MEITNILVACKMSDGTVREIITNRQAEVEVLRALMENSTDGIITISDKPVLGLDIVLPKNAPSLQDYIK